jgi:hypothetical protein
MNKFLFKKKFCTRGSIKFPKISKDISNIQRLDKISIFEYFKLIDERNVSLPHQILVKEIIDYIYSSNFNNEFKYTFLNDEKKFKFLLLNIGLIVNRIENSMKEDNLNLKNYFKNLFSYKNPGKKCDYIARIKIIYFLKFLPLKYTCKEILKFFISNNQIKKKYENNHIIEDQLFKKFTKIDFLFMKVRKSFIDDLNKIEDEEDFKEKYIKNFLLKESKTEKDKSKNIINENDCDKLLLYFIAHVRYSYFMIFYF